MTSGNTAQHESVNGSSSREPRGELRDESRGEARGESVNAPLPLSVGRYRSVLFGAWRAACFVAGGDAARRYPLISRTCAGCV